MESFSIPLPPSVAAPLPPNQLGSGLAPFPPVPGQTGGPPVIDFETLPEPEAELAPPPAGPRGYRHAIPIWFSPRVLQWIVPVCLILVFVLIFFPWVGIYMGGYSLITQSGWQAAFGDYSYDKDLTADKDPFTTMKEGKEERDAPGINLLLIFFVIFMMLLVLVAIGLIVSNVVPGLLPPVVQKWRWLLAGGVALLAFLFLILQLLIGFSLERKVVEKTDAEMKVRQEAAKTDGEKNQLAAARGYALSMLKRTFWLRLAFTLYFLALFCTLLQIWVTRRANRPLPKVELVW
jgi:hypothetical protein